MEIALLPTWLYVSWFSYCQKCCSCSLVAGSVVTCYEVIRGLLVPTGPFTVQPSKVHVAYGSPALPLTTCSARGLWARLALLQFRFVVTSIVAILNFSDGTIVTQLALIR